MKVIIYFTLYFLTANSCFAIDRLVETEYLNSKLNSKNITIIDVRTTDEFQKNHIPNAVNISVKTTFRSKPPVYLIATKNRIEHLFSNAGIRPNNEVILYDNEFHLQASRVYIILKLFGHQNVSILNGGLKKWKYEKRQITKEIFTPHVVAFQTNLKPNYIADRLDIQLSYFAEEVVIIDSRSKDEYHGLKSLASRKGHIPKAINIPWTKNLRKENNYHVFKSKKELNRIYKSISKKKKIYTYCNWGEHSALNLFAMKLININSSSYDGSWIEWGNDESLDIE